MRQAEISPDRSLWRSAQSMATTLATVEAREVLRCARCKLVQFRPSNSVCRRCHAALEIDEPETLSPQLVSTDAPGVQESEGINVARAVREVRHDRCLSQRQLAGRMQVPRTYISKIENGKAVPTLSSLQRLASALEVGVCDLLHDGQSRRARETAAVLADPFLAEIAPMVAQLDAFQRSMFISQVREMATGRRRSA